jgi:hypothetical protein
MLWRYPETKFLKERKLSIMHIRSGLEHHRDERHMLKTSDTIEGQYDSCIGDPIISGKTLAVPALALEIIL